MTLDDLNSDCGQKRTSLEKEYYFVHLTVHFKCLFLLNKPSFRIRLQSQHDGAALPVCSARSFLFSFLSWRSERANLKGTLGATVTVIHTMTSCTGLFQRAVVVWSAEVSWSRSGRLKTNPLSLDRKEASPQRRATPRSVNHIWIWDDPSWSPNTRAESRNMNRSPTGAQNN